MCSTPAGKGAGPSPQACAQPIIPQPLAIEALPEAARLAAAERHTRPLDARPALWSHPAAGGRAVCAQHTRERVVWVQRKAARSGCRWTLPSSQLRICAALGSRNHVAPQRGRRGNLRLHVGFHRKPGRVQVSGGSDQNTIKVAPGKHTPMAASCGRAWRQRRWHTALCARASSMRSTLSPPETRV